jgi:hypothetical protein
MSEYQHYEFQALDRPLTEREMAEVRRWSTRAEITPTRFVNTYQWGDFKGDPDALVEKYYDVFFYFANWGTRELKFRFPRRAVDADAMKPYCLGEGASLKATREYIVLSFLCNQEPPDTWEGDEEARLPALIQLRSDLLDGDLRSLYLGWLLSAYQGDIEENEVEPPIPPGLRSLTASHQAFIEFMRLDPDLVEAAAEASQARSAEDLDDAGVKEWVRELPVAIKDDLLLRLARGREPQLRGEMLRSYRKAKTPVPDHATHTVGRTVADLLAAAERKRDLRRRENAAHAAKKEEERRRLEAMARAEYLKNLGKEEATAWARVDALIAKRQPQSYDEAVSLLRDLHEVLRAKGRASELKGRVGRLRDQHAKKGNFLARLDQADLGHC